MSTRQIFQSGDTGWDAYVTWIALPQLREVRTFDASLNRYVADCGSIYCERSDIPEALGALPAPVNSREYYLLGATVDAPILPDTFEGFEFLGCDLGDETMTSALLNCGPWIGSLRQFALRLNTVGLLSVGDALQAQRLLPTEWGAHEPHASADVWALFGRAGPVDARSTAARVPATE